MAAGELNAVVTRGAREESERPVVLGLHGWGDTATDFAEFIHALLPQTDYACVEGPISLAQLYPQMRPAPTGQSWFSQMLVWDETLAEESARATAAIRAWCDANLVKDRRIVTVGFSQGGFMSTQLLRVMPERICAAVNLSGFHLPAITPELQQEDQALAELKNSGHGVPVFFGFGTADTCIERSEYDATAAWLEAHSALERHIYPGMDHAIEMDEVRDIRKFLAPFTGAEGK